MKQSKELLELKLKNKYHYIWDDLISKSKLELIDIIRHRDDMLDRRRNSNEWHGDATIKVYVDGELYHEVNYTRNEWDLQKDSVFDCASALENQYIDSADVRTEISFNTNWDKL